MTIKTTSRGGEDPSADEPTAHPGWRSQLRVRALGNALAKRTSGVPTYSVPEAAALLSISPEHLYRLIQAGGFPAVRMRISGSQGRYVVPANAVEQLLRHTSETCGPVEVSEWTSSWPTAEQSRRDPKGA